VLAHRNGGIRRKFCRAAPSDLRSNIASSPVSAVGSRWITLDRVDSHASVRASASDRIHRARCGVGGGGGRGEGEGTSAFAKLVCSTAGREARATVAVFAAICKQQRKQIGGKRACARAQRVSPTLFLLSRAPTPCDLSGIAAGIGLTRNMRNTHTGTLSGEISKNFTVKALPFPVIVAIPGRGQCFPFFATIHARPFSIAPPQRAPRACRSPSAV
jgi:hypothetical protein